VRDPAGNPVFSLTVVLAHQPGPDDETLYPLVRQGTLSMELTLAVPHAALDSLRRESEGAGAHNQYRPLFARSVVFSLAGNQQAGGAQIASVSASGPDAHWGVSANLDREATLAVLSALDGDASALDVRAEIAYRVASSLQVIRLSGSWAKIHETLSSYANEPAHSLSREDVRVAFTGMLRSGVIAYVIQADNDGVLSADSSDVNVLFDTFMQASSIILKRDTLELESSDPANRYTLRGHPNEAFNLNIQETLSSHGTKSAVLSAPLETVLGGTLDGLDRDRFIHLLVPTNDGGEGESRASRLISPRRVTSTRKPPGGRKPLGSVPRSRLAILGGGVKSIGLAMRPHALAAEASSALLQDDSARIINVAAGPIKHWWLDFDSLDNQERPGHLPMVDDPNSVIWPDRAKSTEYFYPLTFGLVQPASNANPDTSPFLFTFERVGATASGAPGLDATVKFTLRTTMSDATKSALAALNNPAAKPLPLDGLSVWIELPFRDESGTTRTHNFPADLSLSGTTVVATVKLIDDWVRLLYGALSRPAFQQQPARVCVSYAYRSYVAVSPDDVEVAYGGKMAITPVIYSHADVRSASHETFFDATSATLKSPTAEVRLTREAPSTPDGNAAANRNAATLGLAARPLANAVLARPSILPAIELVDLLARRRYVTRTFIRQQSVDAFFPCDSLGSLYRELSEGKSQAIGCQDALQLGQTTYRQYAEVPELAHEYYTVYRSLQQPGRFLVLPTSYCITRYSPADQSRAYRPVILVYSSIDAMTPANNRVLFGATLQPNLPLYTRRELLAKLAAHALDPRIDYPTSIDAAIDFAWTVGSSVNITPSPVTTHDGFQVTLATDLAGALFLRNILQTSGVMGSATFKLPDGSALRSSLVLDLGGIEGPWDEGPLAVTLAGGIATITNMIESEIEVQELAIYTPDGGPVQRLPVETMLVSGAQHTIALPSNTTAAAFYPVYKVHIGPSKLEEIRSFVEDITTNVIFVDLVNHAEHGLKQLDVQARLAGTDHSYSVPMSGDPASGHIDITLPLTTYLGAPTMQFQVAKTFDPGQVAAGEWIDWNLREMGNIISLVWQLIR
jgi:hypothetical protein